MRGLLDYLQTAVSVSYYDFVLGFVPATFVFALLAGSLLSLPVHVTLAGAAAVAAPALVDAVFLNPPAGADG